MGKRTETLANQRFSESKRARGKLKMLMDENKQAAAAEIKALGKTLKRKTDQARAKNAANKREMAKDLTDATEKFYEKHAALQKENEAATAALNAATAAATVASRNALEASKKAFTNKIVMLNSVVVAHQKKAEKEMAKLTGVVHDYAKASAKDRDLIKAETQALEKDLQKAVARAISIGEAKAKAVEQRIAEHLKNTKRYLQVELNESVERAADVVYKTLEGKRQKIADNYLSLKAYSVAAADKVQDAISKGHGKALSSIGDLLETIGDIGAVKVKPAAGVGMGLGKYLLDKLEASMTGKGVLQVDKVENKAGNYVFINGRSVGLSNKMGLFAELAARMTTYESVHPKMTAKITTIAHKTGKKLYAKPPEWEGN